MKNVIYTTRTCPWCNKAKNYLKEKGVEFEEIDVSIDSEKVQEMVEKSNQMGVPVLDIDGTIIVGFDQGAIDKALSGGK